MRICSLLKCIAGVLPLVTSGCSSQPDDQHVQAESAVQEVQQFTVAVKRDRRDVVDPSWKEKLERVPGVRIKDSHNEYRALIEVSSKGLENIKQLLGDNFHLEPVIAHDKN